MTILLARHGETSDNASRTFQTPDSELSNNGHVQANRLAKRLSEFEISRIICSDYKRTRQTVFPISVNVGIEPEFSPLIRERNFGEIRGQSYECFNFDPFALDYHPPKGESWRQFEQRISRAWDYISTLAQSIDGDLLVVTHGFVCHSIVSNHTQLTGDHTVPTHWSNTSLTLIESQPPWQVSKLNCQTHLDSIATQSNGHA